MNRVNRLIIGELVGPWLFGVAMFTSLLLAATYLGRITEFIVQGVPPDVVLKITLLFIPPILVKTFAMAMLLGALLAFGRLSGDSEIVALRAAGASIYRVIWPVGMFALVVGVITFVLNDTVVPNAVKQGQSIGTEVLKKINQNAARPTFQTIDEDGVLKALLMAQDFSLQKGVLTGVTIKYLDENLQPKFYLEAKEMRFVNEKEWRIVGGATLFSADLRDRVDIAGDVWPKDLTKLNKSPAQVGVADIKDPDYFTSTELREQLSRSNIDKSLTPENYRNREYWLWTKYSVPCAAFVFGILGAALGIRSHRAGTASGFALAISIMFGYMMLVNFMNSWAMGGAMPPAVAAFTPVVLGMVASAYIIHRRNIG